MKANPADKMIRDRLEPGALSLDGFLGSDTRSIQDIIAADSGVVVAAELTTEQLGAFLEEMHVMADQGWEGNVAMYDGRIQVRGVEHMGSIPCPFACGESCHKAMIEVSKDGVCILRFTPLDAHMIAKHGFFEGKGSEYRIEPEGLIDLYRYCTA